MGSKTININKLIYATSGILLGVTLLAFLVLTSSHASADDTPSTTTTTTGSTSATASVNVNAACTMSATDTAHTATLAPGTFTGDIGLTNVTATCNDPLGYTIYAIGYSNNTYGNTSLIGSDDNIINTGTSTSGDTSSWSMKLGTGTGDSVSIVTAPTNYTTYAPVPETYTKVAAYTNGTTTGQAGTSFTTTYGVYTSPSQPAGTYTGAVRYTLVHPHNAIPQDKYYMQDFTLAQCEVLAHNQPITVYDKRDNEPYLVQYLKDGNCWMLDNLRLGSNNQETPLSPLDTNIKEPWTLPKGITEDFHSYVTAQINAEYKNNADVISHGLGSGKVGVYYNYCAASGGTYCHGYEEGVGNAEYSVCPLGWRMPTGGVGGEYAALYSKYSSREAFVDGLSLLASGDYYDNVARQGDYGVFTSSTFMEHEKMYRLNYYASDNRVYPSEYGGIRDRGDTVRCIANNW